MKKLTKITHEKNILGKELKKQIEGIKKKYEGIKEKSPILELDSKITELKREVEKYKTVGNISQKISSTENKKAQKAIKSYCRKHEHKVMNLYVNAVKSKQMKNVKAPFANSKDILYVNYIYDEKDGKQVKNYNRFGIYDERQKEDAYGDLFRTAFDNVCKDRHSVKKNEKTEVNYVKDENQELESVEKYWGSKDFQDYLKNLEESDPKKAEAYKKTQVKKIEAVRKLKGIYTDLNQNRESLENINEAIKELEQAKSVLPKRVYDKCIKSLSDQRKKEIKKEQKILKQKANIFEKTGLSQSVNNAKMYEQTIDKLNETSTPETLEGILEKMKTDLVNAKKLLDEAKANSAEFTNYEDGEWISGYKTNSAVIYEMEKTIEDLNKKIIYQTQENKQKCEERKSLESDINNIHRKEIESTIKGEKSNPLALEEGTETVKPESVKGDRDTSFVQNVEPGRDYNEKGSENLGNKPKDMEDQSR